MSRSNSHQKCWKHLATVGKHSIIIKTFSLLTLLAGSLSVLSLRLDTSADLIIKEYSPEYGATKKPCARDT